MLHKSTCISKDQIDCIRVWSGDCFFTAKAGHIYTNPYNSHRSLTRLLDSATRWDAGKLWWSLSSLYCSWCSNFRLWKQRKGRSRHFGSYAMTLALIAAPGRWTSWNSTHFSTSARYRTFMSVNTMFCREQPRFWSRCKSVYVYDIHVAVFLLITIKNVLAFFRRLLHALRWKLAWP